MSNEKTMVNEYAVKIDFMYLKKKSIYNIFWRTSINCEKIAYGIQVGLLVV